MKYFAQIRTNFIRSTPDIKLFDPLVTYHYEDHFDIDFLGRRILIYAFFYLHAIRLKKITVRTTINELLNICNGKSTPKQYKQTSRYRDLKECISWFIDSDYFKIQDSKSLDDYGLNEMIVFKINEPYFYLSMRGSGEEDKTNEPYIIITEDEFNTLISTHAKNLPRLVAVFAYIKSHCGFRWAGQSIEERPISTGIAQSEIAKHFSCRQSSISNYTQKICDLGLLQRALSERVSEFEPLYIYTYTDQISYKDGKCVIGDWEQELHYGVLKYNANRKKYCGISN